MSSFRRLGDIVRDLFASPGTELPDEFKRRIYIALLAIATAIEAVFGIALLFGHAFDGLTQLAFALLFAGLIVVIRFRWAVRAFEMLVCFGSFAFNAYRTAHDLVLLRQHQTEELYFGFINYAVAFLIFPSNIALVVSAGILGLRLGIIAYHGVLTHGQVLLGEFYAPILSQVLLVMFLYVSTRLRERYQQRLQHQAQHDPLTRLPNRTGFLQGLENALEASARTGGCIGILLIDLDNFKEVNDTFGHEAGDELLVEVANRLRHCCAGDRCTLGRFGGDEFNVMLAGIADNAAVIEAAERIQASMRQPFVVHDRPFYVSCSIGLSVGRHDCSPSDLLRRADMAMYRAKRAGKDGYALFLPEMEQAAREHLKLQTDLRDALAHAEFALHYQPIVDLRSGRVASVEALLRWQHPERGLLLPGRFLSTAEESGLIIPIGHWALEESCRQLAAWERALPAEQVPVVCVNLSIDQVEDPALVPALRGLIERHRISPNRLQVEVTESVLMSDAARTSRVLQELKSLGLTVALDDFGTGYSSLSYLTRLPVDVLKIDRSFLFGLQESEQKRAVLTAIIEVGHALHLSVTAEGVETAEQLDLVRTLGFDSVQGFYFGFPEHADRVTEMLSMQQPRGAAHQGDRHSTGRP